MRRTLVFLASLALVASMTAASSSEQPTSAEELPALDVSILDPGEELPQDVSQELQEKYLELV